MPCARGDDGSLLSRGILQPASFNMHTARTPSYSCLTSLTLSVPGRAYLSQEIAALRVKNTFLKFYSLFFFLLLKGKYRRHSKVPSLSLSLKTTAVISKIYVKTDCARFNIQLAGTEMVKASVCMVLKECPNHRCGPVLDTVKYLIGILKCSMFFCGPPFTKIKHHESTTLSASIWCRASYINDVMNKTEMCSKNIDYVTSQAFSALHNHW